MDGRALASRVMENVAEGVALLEEKPCLAVVLVGDDPASKVYVSSKGKACAKAGMLSKKIELPETTTQEEVLRVVKTLNEDNGVHGILVQLPLPARVDEAEIMKAINPLKDVDGFHPFNVGLLHSGNPRFVPCTPKGIMRLLKEYGVDLGGKHAVVVGRSNLVGKPIASLLLQENATVTACHSKTADLAEHTKRADVLVVAVGRPNTITGGMVKEGAVVIDVGVNRPAEGSLCGDVDFEAVKEKASMITPVPGGVGPMTIAMLLENALEAFKLR